MNASTRTLRWTLLMPLVLMLSACASIEHSASVKLDRQASWVVLPIVNLSETPQAGLRLETLLESQLRAAGVGNLKRYPAEIGADLLLDPRETRLQEQAASWAKAQGARYALTGTVTEWRYKTGVDGEPAVGATLQIVNAQDGAVLYSASGARTGWSRESLTAVAQKLTRELLDQAGLK
ncbi:MAG: penicillin-binding protein activator LpoB [Thiobacillus sp.]